MDEHDRRFAPVLLGARLELLQDLHDRVPVRVGVDDRHADVRALAGGPDRADALHAHRVAAELLERLGVEGRIGVRDVQGDLALAAHRREAVGELTVSTVQIQHDPGIGRLDDRFDDGDPVALHGAILPTNAGFSDPEFVYSTRSERRAIAASPCAVRGARNPEPGPGDPVVRVREAQDR